MSSIWHVYEPLLMSLCKLPFQVMKHFSVSKFCDRSQPKKTRCLIAELIIPALSFRIKGNAEQETSKECHQ